MRSPDEVQPPRSFKQEFDDFQTFMICARIKDGEANGGDVLSKWALPEGTLGLIFDHVMRYEALLKRIRNTLERWTCNHIWEGVALGPMFAYLKTISIHDTQQIRIVLEYFQERYDGFTNTSLGHAPGNMGHLIRQFMDMIPRNSLADFKVLLREFLPFENVYVVPKLASFLTAKEITPFCEAAVEADNVFLFKSTWIQHEKDLLQKVFKESMEKNKPNIVRYLAGSPFLTIDMKCFRYANNPDGFFQLMQYDLKKNAREWLEVAKNFQEYYPDWIALVSYIEENKWEADYRENKEIVTAWTNSKKRQEITIDASDLKAAIDRHQPKALLSFLQDDRYTGSVDKVLQTDQCLTKIIQFNNADEILCKLIDKGANKELIFTQDFQNHFSMDEIDTRLYTLKLVGYDLLQMVTPRYTIAGFNLSWMGASSRVTVAESDELKRLCELPGASVDAPALARHIVKLWKNVDPASGNPFGRKVCDVISAKFPERTEGNSQSSRITIPQS